MVDNSSKSFFAADKPDKRNSFVEKLDPGFFDHDELNVLIGASHVEQLWSNKVTDGIPLCFIFKAGAGLCDMICALRAFMSNLPVRKDVNVLIWSPLSDLKCKFFTVFVVHTQNAQFQCF